MQKVARKTAVVVATLVIGGVVIWPWIDSTVNQQEALDRSRRILEQVVGIDLDNSWNVIQSSGGRVGFLRPEWEYYVLFESSHHTVETLSTNLAEKKWVHYLPLDYAGLVEPHPNSSKLASWWQPESNREPQYLYGRVGYGRHTVYIYAYQKETNALLYIRIVER
jgi:hypothetical protein